MNRFWQRYSFYIHIAGWLIAMAFTAGMVWAGMSKYDDRITSLEATQGKQQTTLTRVDYNIQIIARKIGVRPLEKVNDE